MAKRFKLRISKAVSSSFNTCRSKDPSTLPQDPVPSFFQHHQHHPCSSFKHHVSAALVTIDCRCSSRNEDAYTSNDMISTTRSHSQEFKWQKEEKWHVVANNHDEDTTPRRKISYSSVSDDSGSEILALPPPPPSFITEKNTRRSKKKKNKTRFRMSTSSADESGIFSSSETWSEVDNKNEEEEETETLISSCKSLDLEYSTDSSTEFNQQLETIYETNISRGQKVRSSSSKTRVKHSKRSITRGINIGRRSSVSTTSSDDNELPPRLSTFKKLIPCNMDGKVKESFAIMKKSQDPYEDFRRSMMEMILEKQMFEKNDLEQLLQCFLSLNAKNYHGVIVEAFSEIWKTLFSLNDHKNSVRTISTHHNRHL